MPLTAEGREQARATRELFVGVELDRVVASRLPRTQETAALVAPGHEAEIWPELREIKGAKLSVDPRSPSSRRRSSTPSAASSRTTGGFSAARRSASSSTASCPAVERLVAEDELGHGARRRPRRRQPRDPLVRADGRAELPRPLRAGAGLRERARRHARGEPTGSSARSTSRRATSRTGRRARRRWSSTGRSTGSRPTDGARGGIAPAPRSDASVSRGYDVRRSPAHFSFDTGWKPVAVKLHDPLALDRQLVVAGGPLAVAREQERVGLVPGPVRPHEGRPGRVPTRLVHQLHERVRDGHAVQVEAIRRTTARVVLGHDLLVELHAGVVVPRRWTPGPSRTGPSTSAPGDRRRPRSSRASGRCPSRRPRSCRSPRATTASALAIA